MAKSHIQQGKSRIRVEIHICPDKSMGITVLKKRYVNKNKPVFFMKWQPDEVFPDGTLKYIMELIK